METVRGSYRQQLVNAIQKIAGEYKVSAFVMIADDHSYEYIQAYYDELLSGKSGRHDLKIMELKEK